MVQKIIKIGNSYGVILPKEVMEATMMNVGDEVEIDSFPENLSITLRSPKAPYKTMITPEFKQWLNDFVTRNHSLLKTLAKTP